MTSEPAARWNPCDDIRKASTSERADVRALATAMSDAHGHDGNACQREVAFAATIIEIAMQEKEHITMRDVEKLEQSLHESFRRTLSQLLPAQSDDAGCLDERRRIEV